LPNAPRPVLVRLETIVGEAVPQVLARLERQGLLA
jgi:hypothetical protein